jgi:hypothetical protein
MKSRIRFHRYLLSAVVALLAACSTTYGEDAPGAPDASGGDAIATADAGDAREETNAPPETGLDGIALSCAGARICDHFEDNNILVPWTAREASSTLLSLTSTDLGMSLQALGGEGQPQIDFLALPLPTEPRNIVAFGGRIRIGTIANGGAKDYLDVLGVEGTTSGRQVHVSLYNLELNVSETFESFGSLRLLKTVTLETWVRVDVVIVFESPARVIARVDGVQGPTMLVPWPEGKTEALRVFAGAHQVNAAGTFRFLLDDVFVDSK